MLRQSLLYICDSDFLRCHSIFKVHDFLGIGGDLAKRRIYGSIQRLEPLSNRGINNRDTSCATVAAVKMSGSEGSSGE